MPHHQILILIQLFFSIHAENKRFLYIKEKHTQDLFWGEEINRKKYENKIRLKRKDLPKCIYVKGKKKQQTLETAQSLTIFHFPKEEYKVESKLEV